MVPLNENISDDFTVYIGKSKVSAGVTVSQFGVIHPQAIQHRGVQVMNRHTIFNRLEAELIRSAVNESTFDSAPSENHCETVRIVIPAGAAFRNWSATELATPQH